MADGAHIVVVDDEASIVESLRTVLEREGYRVTATTSGVRGLELIRSVGCDLLLSDVMMPDMSGIDLLKAVKLIAPATEVLVMTAYGTVELAVEAMREGAYDFISKPFRRTILVQSIRRALERHRLVAENQRLRATLQSVQPEDGLVGQSVVWRDMLAMIEQAATSQATILVLGESGTGKELLARLIHRRSERRDGPFVAVNCAALPEGLLESELFGHERGAFTGAHQTRTGRFERADRGTLFLDEIGETSPALQVRLLRALQEGEIERVGGQETRKVDVRVVAATHRDLQEAVREGRFREDLYYRLNVIEVRVPPLRDRVGDVTLLAQYFVTRYAQKNGREIVGVTDEALRKLEAYRWPGNVRELENAIERAVVLTRGDHIDVHDLPDTLVKNDEAARGSSSGFFVPFGWPIEAVERLLIQETLARVGGDKRLAARMLGIATRTIYRKLDTAPEGALDGATRETATESPWEPGSESEP